MKKEDTSYVENLGKSIRSSVTVKLISIFILMLLLMIPVTFVQSLIEERESLRQQTINEVSDKWANEQLVFGPVLTIPLEKEVIQDDKTKIIKTEAHFLPSQLKINGEVSPQNLKRGIYEVVVYNSKLSLTGQFDNLQKYVDELIGYNVKWQEAFLTIHISDLRGIKEEIDVRWNGNKTPIEPGTKIPAIIASGVTVIDVLDTNIEKVESHDFLVNLKLQGSHHLGYVPLGKETTIMLSSEWESPSFSGAFIPDERTINEDGFIAQWKVLELNRNFPQYWIGDKYSSAIAEASFGVDLIIPANEYQQAMRSAKYALLTISLTFLTVFLVEIFNKRKVHPFQYILIGLALCLFYTLLVSISEHAGFTLAYVTSSAIIIAIIGLYAKAILKNARQTVVLIVILCFSYTFVYVTLQIQDYALLIGSVGLTAILAFAMYITRDINWYELSLGKNRIEPTND